MRRWVLSLFVAPPERDFPYAAGRPSALTPWGRAGVLLGCAGGFASFLVAPQLIVGRLGDWTGVALFVLIPLAALRLAAGDAWRAPFRRPTARDVWLGLLFAPLTFLVSAVVAVILMTMGLTADNPIGHVMSEARGGDLALYFLSTGVQLMGEELVTILPFLVFLNALLAGDVQRRRAIVVAWIATALIFGALHLPTYQWHWAQSLIVIGMARLVLTAPFLITRNIWSSYIAHLANDWTLFTLMLVLPKVAAAAALR